MPLYVFFLLVGLAIAFFAYRRLQKQRRRADLLAGELYADERDIIARAVPLVAKLPPELRKRHEGKVNLFLDQVEFVGCNGLSVTQEMELSIAAQACLLVTGRDIWFENLRQVLIYPSAFKSVQAQQQGYIVTEREITRLGESWVRGPVILSWKHSAEGARDPADGHNVVIHEFAHQLDDLTGHTNAIPLLAKTQSFAEWEAVMLASYDAHVRAVERGQKTVIDPYGAESHVEFFAVAVEAFFETPGALRASDPALYAELAKLFQLDPAIWA